MRAMVGHFFKVMESTTHPDDEVNSPIPTAMNGSADENRAVGEKQTKSNGKKYRPPKHIRDALKKQVDEKIKLMLEQNKLSNEFYAYRKIEPVYKNRKFVGFKCSWKPTIEMPASFFENPEPLAKLNMYKNKTIEEIVEDLIEKQKQLDESEQEQDVNEGGQDQD